MGVFNTIEHYDGSNWTVVSEGPLEGTEPFYQAIWGTSATNIYAAARCSMPPGPPVGGCLDGFVYHYDGFTWTKIYQLAEGWLYGIWGISDTNDVVYAVGDNGTIVHYNETTWTVMDSGTEVTLHGIWFDSPTDVFVVGDIGTILHYDGIDWSPMPSGTTERLRAIWGSSPTNVYAVGNNGTILHYDGSSWTQMNIGYDSVIFDIWGDSETDIFASCNGAVFRYDGDYDSDGIPDASDNCLDTPNGTALGLCAQTECGVYRYSLKECINNTECVDHYGACWTCLKNQEDIYPPGGNDTGDACEWCYANFDGDSNVYPSDLSIFLGEYGRTDCIISPPCQADMDGDGNVYPSDLSIFLAEYGKTDCPVIP